MVSGLEMNLGFQFDGAARVTHAIFADNIFLISHSKGQLLNMFDMVTKEIYSEGLKWKTSELHAMRGSNLPAFADKRIVLPDGETALIRFREQLEVLGVMLDRRGSTSTSIEHRLSKAEGAYGSLAMQLKNSKLPVSERIAAWSRGPIVSALYGAGGWHITATQLGDLRRWECRHIKRFLKMKRAHEDESPVEYHRRTNLAIHRLFVKHRVLPIYLKTLKLQHSWASQWWNLRLDDGSNPLKEYMNLRPAATWKDTQDMMAQLDYNNGSGWRHQHGGTRAQWEDTYNKSWPSWREDLDSGLARWNAISPNVLFAMCQSYSLSWETLVSEKQTFSEVTNANTKLLRAKGRGCQKLDTSQWHSDGFLPGNLGEALPEDAAWSGNNSFEFWTDSQTPR